MGSREPTRNVINMPRSSSRTSSSRDLDRPRSKSREHSNQKESSPVLSKAEYPVVSTSSRKALSGSRSLQSDSAGGFIDCNGNIVKGRRSRTSIDDTEVSKEGRSVVPSNDVETSRPSRSSKRETKNLNPFLESRSPSRARDGQTLNPFLESRSPSRSKSRSKGSDDSKHRSSESRSNSRLKVEQNEIQKGIRSSNNSVEGTPVILSREGSMIRIVDEETGEIFFRKRSKSRLRDYGGKIPVFVPRQSWQSEKGQVPEDQSISISSNLDVTELNKYIGAAIHPFINEEDEGYAQETMALPSELISLEPLVPIQKVSEPKVTISENTIKPGILKNSNSKLGNADTSSSNIYEEVPSKLRENTEPPLRESRSRSKDRLPTTSSDVQNRNTEPSRTKSRSKSRSPDKASKSSSRRRTKSQEKVADDGNPFLTTSPTKHRSRSRSDKRLGHERSMLIPDEILEKIFSFLKPKDLEICSRVSRRWKKLTDPNIRGPVLFTGKSFYGHHYSRRNSKTFVTFLRELEAKFYRPYEIQLRNVKEFQVSVLCQKLGHEFKSSVRHMVALQLANSRLKWKTLILLLQSFVNLRTLSDTNSSHYSNSNPWGGCLRNRQNLKKELKRQEYIDLKYQLKRIKAIKISRLTIDQELVIYLHVLTQGARNVEEFELSLGPWETSSKSNEDELCSSLQPFIKVLNLFLNKNCKTLKILKFNWSDKNYIGFFQKCLDAFDNLKLPKLTEVIFQFDKNSLKNPRNLMKLRQFLELHCAKGLRKVTISKLPLGESWYQTFMFIDELMSNEMFSTVFNFEIILTDCCLKMAESTLKILRIQVFQKFTTDIHISIENDKTQSLAQLVGMQMKDQYPRVKSVLVTFDPDAVEAYPHFRDLCIGIIAHNYPNLTQLRISDRFVHHRDMFNRVTGRSSRAGVSKASLGNEDLQLICAALVNLKVLKLWVDLTKVDDHGITGIHQGDILILLEDDVHYSWNNFGYQLQPNFSRLKNLEELSLRGLGQLVTNISAKFGFENMEQLKILELFGDMKVQKSKTSGNTQCQLQAKEFVLSCHLNIIDSLERSTRFKEEVKRKWDNCSDQKCNCIIQ